MKLFLFDVDGTLVESGQKITEEMKIILNKIKSSGFEIGIVGGGKYDKIKEQIDDIKFDYLFTENGCVYHKNDVLIHKKNINFNCPVDISL